MQLYNQYLVFIYFNNYNITYNNYIAATLSDCVFW